MVSKDLLDILRCPVCVQEKSGLVDYVKESWLICQDCGRKYPIRQDIPVMLIDEGDRWGSTRVEDLPVPPPGRDTGSGSCVHSRMSPRRAPTRAWGRDPR